MSEVAGDLARDEWSDDDLFGVVQGRRLPSPRGLDRGRALEMLFERYHARVHGQCYRLLGDDRLADDITQEIFLSLLEQPIHYEGRRHFGSWLYIVVRNRCLNLRRHRQREVMGDDAAALWIAALTDPSDPGQECEQSDMARLIDQTCRQELTPRELEVIHLRYFWGMRVKEINRVLGLENSSGARTHLATAHRKLRQALSARFGENVQRTFLEG